MTSHDPSSTFASRMGAVDSQDAVSVDDGLVRPINWNVLTAAEAENEWLDLNAWVHWLRFAYGLPVAIIPPLWHRHNALVLELSALHRAWLASVDPDGPPGGQLQWHEQFTNSRHRLREWVQMAGTKLDRDRPTRITTWPGDEPQPPAIEAEITDREADFYSFVALDLAARRSVEERVARRRALHST